MEPKITLLGLSLACAFAFSVGGILWWMLHPPAQIGAAVAKARRSVGAIKKILVPTSGMPYSEKGIELACRLGMEQKAEIVLTYVLEVPRTLPLGAPLPEAEAIAQQALERGKDIVELHQLVPIVLIERAREAGEGIIKAAKDNQADVIVLGIRPGDKGGKSTLGKTTETLIRKAPCEVIIDKIEEEE
jgi:nucleotide-binding universal stress UspA family protein